MTRKDNNIPYTAALVTGGAARIGRAISIKLADMGLAIAIHHRSSDKEAVALAEYINDKGGHAITVEGDLSKAEAPSQIFKDATEKLQMPIDVLVNNASLFEADKLTKLTTDLWDMHQNINLRSPVFLAQELANALPSNQEGSIINLIDQRVLKLNPQFFSYTASKAGLWTVTRTMAQSLAPNIRVNAIGPGPTLGSIHQTDDEFASEAANVPLGKGPTLAEIADAVAFLLATPSMTGQMLTLDGGQHLAWHTKDITVE